MDEDTTTKVRKRPRWGRLKRSVLVVGILALLFVAGSYTSLLVLAADAPQDAHADAIFVPGAAVWRKRKPSDALEARLQKALELYRAGRAPKIVCSGGGSGDYLEAAVMADWLLARGVPQSAVVTEGRSRTTRENAQLSAPILREHEIRSVLAVSQWFHLGRVRVALEQEGVRVLPVSCRGPKLVSEPIFLAKELVALPLYIARLDLWR